MDDPRLNSGHLYPPRRARYAAARAEMLDAIGSTTQAVEREVLSYRAARIPFAVPVSYFLRDVRTGRLYPLRVGINAVGRRPENDIVLEEICISRRHCVILVHATGGCEIHDTASRHGTLVNGRKVSRSDLYPEDRIRLCNDVFVVVGDVADDAEVVIEEMETGELSAIGTGRR